MTTQTPALSPNLCAGSGTRVSGLSDKQPCSVCGALVQVNRASSRLAAHGRRG